MRAEKTTFAAARWTNGPACAVPIQPDFSDSRPPRDRFELAEDCAAFGAYVLEQPADTRQIATAAGSLELAKGVGENSGAYSPRARLERVRRALDLLGIAVLDRPLQVRESSGTVLHERLEKNCEHFFDAAFAQVRAETLDIYSWVHGRDD